MSDTLDKQPGGTETDPEMEALKARLAEAALKIAKGETKADVPGRRDSGRGLGGVVVGFLQHFARAPMYMFFALACLGILTFAAYYNHEPVATAVGIVATAVFGGGAAKTFVDQKWGNGNGK